MENQQTSQPDELGELKKVVTEFLERNASLDREIETLKEDKKALFEEFKTKIDMKTLNTVLRIKKLRASVVHKYEFDTLSEILEES